MVFSLQLYHVVVFSVPLKGGKKEAIMVFELEIRDLGLILKGHIL